MAFVLALTNGLLYKKIISISTYMYQAGRIMGRLIKIIAQNNS